MSRGFDVQANGVTITGFVVRSDMGVMDTTDIYTSPQHSGYRLDKNVVETTPLASNSTVTALPAAW